MSNPRQKFVDWLAGHDPSKVEALVTDLHSVSDTAFDKICEFANALTLASDPGAAADSAIVEVRRKPQRADGKRTPPS